jgi:phosphoglycolate phosphatase-like HAD superfamily hydrolase
VAEHLRLNAINTDWSSYRNTTDPGIVMEVYQRHFGRMPTSEELGSVQDLLVEKFIAAIGKDRDRCRQITGATKLIAALRDSPDFDVGVATGAWRRVAAIKLEAAAINISDLPFASGDDAIDRHTIFSQAIARSSASFDRVVLVGDGIWDVRIAALLGAAFLGIGNGDSVMALRGAGASDVIENFQNTSSVIAKLRAALVPG